MSRHRGDRGWPEPRQRRDRRAGGGVTFILYLAIGVLIIAVFNIEFIAPPDPSECKDYRRPALVPQVDWAFPNKPTTIKACGLDAKKSYTVETGDGRILYRLSNNTIDVFVIEVTEEEFGEERQMVLNLVEDGSGDIVDSVFILRYSGPDETIIPTVPTNTTTITNGSFLVTNKIYKS